MATEMRVVKNRKAQNLPKFLKLVGSNAFWTRVANDYGLFTARMYAKRAPKHWSTQSKTLRSFQQKPAVLQIFPISKSVIFSELGTRPHRIRPRREGGMLAWRSGVKSKRFRQTPDTFAKQVEHPGIQATRLVGRTVVSSYAVFLRTRLRDLIAAALRGEPMEVIKKSNGGSKYNRLASRKIRRRFRRLRL